MIPNRCRSCVHWMGRESELANDPRCDREWGWSMSFLGEKRFVEFECSVPLWGDEIPMLDEYGNPLPGDRDSRNPRVDAYVPARFSRDVPETIELRSHDIQGFFTADELVDLFAQMKDTSKLFEKRSARREALTKNNISTHKRKMGSIGQVATADYQPPYETGKERIPTGLVQLDFALRGGITPGTTIGLWGEKHIGKGHPVSEPVLTPDGWQRVGDLKVSDKVIGRSGKPTQVTGVFPRGVLPTYRVSFSDGGEVLVDSDHLWHVQTRKQTELGENHFRVLSTAELLETGVVDAKNASKYWIPLVDPVEYASEAELPISSYLLGVYIANGSLSFSGTISTNDEAVMAEVARRSPFLLVTEHAPASARRFYVSDPEDGYRDSRMRDGLRALSLWGKKAPEKFVPEIYLRAAIEDRHALLQGLMDCDGGLTSYGNTQYHTRSMQLAYDVQDLVRSLGGVASVRSYTRENGTDYVVNLKLPSRFTPFRACAAKREGYASKTHREPTRRIRSIEPAGRDDVVCIQVEAEDRLYVAKDYVVTHNTTLSHRFEAAILDYYRQRVYDFMIEQGRSEEDAQAAADEEQGLAIATEPYDSTYAGRLGVKTNQVLRPRFEYGEQYLQYIVDHVRGDVKEFAEFKEPGVFSYMLPISTRYYKIDSVDAMKWWSDEHGARNKENVLHDNQKMGARASLLSQFFRVAAAAPGIPITSIFITQERTNMAGTTAWKDGLRGNAFAHNIRLEIRMKKNGSAPKEGDTTRMVDLEFRQLQMAGGTNLTERSVVTLVQRLEGGFYPKDQAVYCAAERGILKIKGGGHWDYDTRSGESYTGASLDCRTSDVGAIADKLDELGLIPEVYQRVMNVYSGREMDADGNVAALETEIAGDTSVDIDEEGARQIEHQEAQS